jgi:hypothetical protein
MHKMKELSDDQEAKLNKFVWSKGLHTSCVSHINVFNNHVMAISNTQVKCYITMIAKEFGFYNQYLSSAC